MRLRRLRLKNFKGADDFVLFAGKGGESLDVLGDNATGKTTLFDAWAWLLFGKDSSGAANFSIKTLDPATGEAIHGLDHEVEAELLLPDGGQRTLAKTYREQWVKKRGAADRTFSGHTVDHFVDGVPVAKGEYDKAVAALLPSGSERDFRILTDPLEFCERLDWRERRDLLLKLCGDVSVDDILAGDPMLSELLAALPKGRTVEEHRRVLDARSREVNSELERIPVRIDEVRRGRPELPVGLTREAAEAELAAMREDRARLSSERDAAAASSGLREAVARRGLLKDEADRAEARERQRERELRWKRESAAAEREEKEKSARARLDRAAARASEIRRRLNSADVALAELRDDWAALDASTFEPRAANVADSCAACGQALPAAEVEAALERARAAFNLDKARRLETLSGRGRELRSNRDRLEAEANEAQDAAGAAAEELEAALAAKKEPLPEAGTDEELEALAAESAAARAALATAEEELAAVRAAIAAGGSAELEAALAASDAAIAAAEGRLALFAQAARADERDDELRREERRLAAEFEQLQRLRWLSEQYVRVRVGLIEEHVNGRFELVRFQLFRELVNGGLEECCEATVRGVPYGSGLNHGARIAAGLDIVKTFQEHWGAWPPIFVDQCESVTRLPEMPGQVIRLVVAAGEPRLKVVVASRPEDREEVSA